VTPREVLLAAAELLEPEGRWTQGVVARNVGNGSVDSVSVDAVCWCAYGAIEKVALDADFPELVEDVATAAFCAGIGIQAGGLLAGEQSGLWFEFARIVGELLPRYLTLGTWNDAPGRTQAEVVAALRAAAAQVQP
jgi:hypothetical protein